MKTIRLHDKTFQRSPYPTSVSADAIGGGRRHVSTSDYAGRENAACSSAYSTVRSCSWPSCCNASSLDCEVSFVKIASYSGTASTGAVHGTDRADAPIFSGRHVVIVEDIVDTGASIEHTAEPCSSGRRLPRASPSPRCCSSRKLYRKEIGIDYCALTSFRQLPGRVRARLRSAGTQSERYLRTCNR